MSVRIEIPKKDIQRLEEALSKFGTTVEKSRKAERMFDTALRKAATPWQRAFKGGAMYRKVRRVTGGFEDPMGNRKIKGRRSSIYGRRVGPKMKGKSAGWRAHFFASPARQISPKKRVPFASMYKKENGKVRKILREELSKLLNYFAKQNFK